MKSLHYWTISRATRTQDKSSTVSHLIILTSKRTNLCPFFLDLEDVRSLSLWGIVNLIKGTGLLGIRNQFKGPKGPVQKALVHRTGRARTHFYSLLSFHLRLGPPSPNRSFSWRFSCMVFCPFHSPFLVTPWSRVLLEKLTGSQLVKKFPALYETRSFINAFTSARQLSLSWTRSIQSILIHPTS